MKQVPQDRDPVVRNRKDQIREFQRESFGVGGFARDGRGIGAMMHLIQPRGKRLHAQHRDRNQQEQPGLRQPARSTMQHKTDGPADENQIGAEEPVIKSAGGRESDDGDGGEKSAAWNVIRPHQPQCDEDRQGKHEVRAEHQVVLILKEVIRRQREKDGDGDGDRPRNAELAQRKQRRDGRQRIAGQIKDVDGDGPVSGQEAQQFQCDQVQEVAVGKIDKIGAGGCAEKRIVKPAAGVLNGLGEGKIVHRVAADIVKRDVKALGNSSDHEEAEQRQHRRQHGVTGDIAPAWGTGGAD